MGRERIRDRHVRRVHLPGERRAGRRQLIGSSKGPAGSPLASDRLQTGLAAQQKRTRDGEDVNDTGTWITTLVPSTVPAAYWQLPVAVPHSSKPMATAAL